MLHAGSAENSPPPFVVKTSSADDTVRLGRLLAPALIGGVVISVEGDLGSGKTQLCKGLIAGATGVSEAKVRSPAYTLINEYPREAGGPVVHIDFYRINALSMEDELLFDEALSNDISAALIEWGDKFVATLARSYVRIKMHMSSDKPDLCTLSFDVVGDGQRETNVIDAWRTVCAHF